MSQETAKIKKSALVELAAFLVFVLAGLVIVSSALSSKDWGTMVIMLEVQLIAIGVVVFWKKHA